MLPVSAERRRCTRCIRWGSGRARAASARASCTIRLVRRHGSSPRGLVGGCGLQAGTAQCSARSDWTRVHHGLGRWSPSTGRATPTFFEGGRGMKRSTSSLAACNHFVAGGCSFRGERWVAWIGVVDTESLCLHSSCELGHPCERARLGARQLGRAHEGRAGRAAAAAIRGTAPPRLSVVSLQLPSSDRRQATANQPGAEQAGACAACATSATRGTAADQAQFPVARATPASSCPNLRLQPAIAGEAGQRRRAGGSRFQASPQRLLRRRPALGGRLSRGARRWSPPRRQLWRARRWARPSEGRAAQATEQAAGQRRRRRRRRRFQSLRTSAAPSRRCHGSGAALHVGVRNPFRPRLVAGHLLERTLGVMRLNHSLRAF